MIYKNNDINAVYECERQRTGNYGEDYEDYECKDDTAFMYDEDDWADEKYDELFDDVI